jgi:meso-butanediol dehydrogenase / (S,S)-butanediol dehydrogenase / diacetyl reductase
VTKRLEGKVALITGTGGGQGRAAALKFAEEGAAVVGCDLKEEGNRETVAMVEGAGGQMTGMEPVDLGDSEQARAWVDEAAAVHGRIDVLYNNASAPKFAPIPDLSIEDWDFTIRNELDLVFYVTKYAWRYLAERGGVILSTASVAGLQATRDTGLGAHSAAKGGVLALSRVFAADGAVHGIRAVTISPGPIETPGTAELFANPEARAYLSGMLLSPRLGQADDVAALAAFLASDEAGWITGVDVPIDGGMTAI